LSTSLQFDNPLWNDIRPMFIRFAIHYRLQYDVLFRNIIQSLKDAQYIIEYTESANNAHLESGKIKNGIANAIIAETGLGDVETAEKALQPPRKQGVVTESVAPQVPIAAASIPEAPKEVPLFQGEPITSIAEVQAEPEASIPPISLFEEEPSEE